VRAHVSNQVIFDECPGHFSRAPCQGKRTGNDCPGAYLLDVHLEGKVAKQVQQLSEGLVIKGQKGKSGLGQSRGRVEVSRRIERFSLKLIANV
jgi:hypothetical protein